MGFILFYKSDKTIMPPPSRPSPPAPANGSPATIITTPNTAPCSNSSGKHSVGKNSSSSTCNVSINDTDNSKLFQYESDLRTDATFLNFSISLALRVVSLLLACAMFMPGLVTWDTANPKNYEEVRIQILTRYGSLISVSHCLCGQWEFDEADADIYICVCLMEPICHRLSNRDTFPGYSQILETCYSTNPNRGNDFRSGVCRSSLSICQERTTSSISGHP